MKYLDLSWHLRSSSECNFYSFSFSNHNFCQRGNVLKKRSRLLLFLVDNHRTMDEAIKRANSSRYGLAAGILTKDLNVANTVSRSIRAGTIWINCYFAFDNDCPFGGYKMSGFGRDNGLEALHKYLQVKAVVTPLHDSPWL